MNNPLVIPMTISENTTTFEMDIDTAINVSGDVDIRSLNVTENGTYREEGKAYSPVTVNVPQPSGTKQISITQNGTQTEDVEWYEDAELTVNVPNTYTASDEGKVVSSGALVSQTSRTVSDNGTYDTTLNNQVVVNNEDYSEALVAFGVTEDLADGIEAMTTYSNEVTGESDTTLSDAVRTLADGYRGGGSGVEYETGIYVPTVNEQAPTIYFANAHSTPPSIIVFEDVSAESPSISNTDLFVYVNSLSIFGNPLLVKNPTFYSEYVGHVKRHNNGNVTNGVGEYTRGEITSTSFRPYAATNYIYPAGHTLKWIAVWSPTQPAPTPRGLPTEYQEVKFIQSSGTQWIDTGFYPNTTTTKVELGITPQSLDVTQGVCGARGNDVAADETACNIFLLAAGTYRFDWINGDVSKSYPVATDIMYRISCTRGLGTINDISITGTNTDSITESETFLIGNFNNNGAAYTNGFKGCIHYAKLYSNDVLIRDLVPCYRKADDVIGMYDLVNDAFYTNAGTGTFTKGGDI